MHTAATGMFGKNYQDHVSKLIGSGSGSELSETRNGSLS
jgi:hypothetical protein